MRFMITAAPDPSKPKPAADAPFDEALFSAYMTFNEALHVAGVLVTSEGLNPGKKGAQVAVSTDGKRAVVDGPFAESKELVGGFYLIDVASLDEAIAWALRAPSGMGSDDILTIHPMTEASDLPPELVQLIETAAPKWSAVWKGQRQ
jgi:hypothetical protein